MPQRDLDMPGEEAARTNLSSLVAENTAGILILDAVGNIRFANPAAVRLLGASFDVLIGAPFGVPSSVGTAVEIDVITAAGTPGVALMVVSESVWDGADAYLAILFDITERKANEERMRTLAFADPLTGLPNRNLFINRLQQNLSLAQRERKGLAVLFVDIDRFKAVNDTLGHAFGDLLLQEVASRLSSALRASDTVARMGGDEFTAIVFGIDDEPTAEQVARKLLAALEPPCLLDGHEFYVSVSIGIALYPRHSDDPDLLLRHADSAMYDAKRHRRGSFSLYREGMTTLARSRMELEHDLHAALANHEFVLLYQPQINLADGAVIGAEALLRWQHPRKGQIEPERFLPLLEDTDMVVEVGRWVLREACRQAHLWQAGSTRPVRVAVNVSAVEIEFGRFPEEVERVLAEEGLDPGSLFIEISEGALFRSMTWSGGVLNALSNYGVELHVDDFESGYSALELIKRIPFTSIKIDRSFVGGLESTPGAKALIQATIEMAHGLGKRVIAEGVETERQADLLRDLGCDAGQGWWFGRPVPPEGIHW